MKINPIKIYNKLNFGYNKQYHQKVESHLTAQKTPVAVAMRIDDINNIDVEYILIRM